MISKAYIPLLLFLSVFSASFFCPSPAYSEIQMYTQAYILTHMSIPSQTQIKTTIDFPIYDMQYESIVLKFPNEDLFEAIKDHGYIVYHTKYHKKNILPQLFAGIKQTLNAIMIGQWANNVWTWYQKEPIAYTSEDKRTITAEWQAYTAGFDFFYPYFKYKDVQKIIKQKTTIKYNKLRFGLELDKLKIKWNCKITF